MSVILSELYFSSIIAINPFAWSFISNANKTSVNIG